MPTHKDIEELAYDLWEREGKPHGNDHHYYYQAEKQLSAQPTPKKATTARKTTAPKATAKAAAPKSAPAKAKTTTRKAA